MCCTTTTRDGKAVEQCSKGQTEKSVAEEIGRKVQQNGCINIVKAYLREEVNQAVGHQQEQCTAHDTPRTEVVCKNRFARGSGQQKVDTEEDHQRHSDAERISVERVFLEYSRFKAPRQRCGNAQIIRYSLLSPHIQK